MRSPLIAILFGLITVVTTSAKASPNDDSRVSFLGLDISSSQSQTGGVLIDPSFTLGYASPYFDGSMSLGTSSANLLGGERRAFRLVPAIGYHIGFRRDNKRIQLFGLGRLPIQWRTGANLASARGVAMSIEAGVRLWGCGRTRFEHLCVGLGVSARYQLHLTRFQVSSAVLPAASSVMSFPVTLAVALTFDGSDSMRCFPAVFLVFTACGVTFGVHAEERSIELDISAEGITRFDIANVSVDDEVVVRGGNTSISAQLDLLEWGDPGDRIRAELVTRRDGVELQMIGGESVSLVRVDAFVPERVTTSISLGHGRAVLSDLSAPVFVRAGSIDLRDIDAPVVSERGRVEFDYAIPIDLRAEGSVSGCSSAGGFIVTESSAEITLTSLVSDLEIQSLSDADASVELYLPRGGSWTVHLRTPGHAVLDVEGFRYDSTDEGAPSAEPGLDFNVGAGGPEITVTATGSVIITESTYDRCE